MTIANQPSLADMASPGALTNVPASVELWMTELHSLLKELEAATSATPELNAVLNERLVQGRLGIAASLFASLQCKNAAIAGHSLRVALGCSAWSAKLRLSDAERDAIEVAALLHDIGSIGVPDRILQKPASLNRDESQTMGRARQMGFEILRHGCASREILRIVDNVSAWYDGSREGFELQGRDLPLGSRMIAIVQAFDSMTTDQVYRPARSQERAMTELFACAGTQFDPDLVQQFSEFRQEDPATMRWETAHRWLRVLDPDLVDACWDRSNETLPSGSPSVEALFQSRLLDNMYDAVVFIDASGCITSWNRGAERLTGINVTGIRGKPWNPALLQISDEQGRPIGESDCPVNTAIRCGAQSLRRMTIVGRGQRQVAVDVHAIPVIDKQSMPQGAILLFHDASSETSLEQRCQSLHEKATKDPLTQVANRAEFDRVHSQFVAAHQQQQVPCSLLMCDLDHFKRVNDTYGHQAGDDAIKSLACLLKSSCRPGDLVARYGGEEFVMLCADCDNGTAARRADQIRKALSQLPQPRMGDHTITVSFGVTEIQPGDTPETMLRRADRALLKAKANGRNTVVQLGAGIGSEPDPLAPKSDPLGINDVNERYEQSLVTPVPLKIVVEKLRGFVADHQARIISVEDNHVRIEIHEKAPSGLRRFTDRPAVFCIDLRFEEQVLQKERGQETSASLNGSTRTRILAGISPRKNRDRRRNDVMSRARGIMVSLRSYLMAVNEETDEAAAGVTTRPRVPRPE